MKTILLFRHGKSNWDAAHEHDQERPLSKRGRKAAELMGTFLKAVDEMPGLILTSPAVRAADTAKIAAKGGRWTAPVHTVPTLYEASAGALLREVQSTPDEVERLMLVGHEPAWSDFTGRLIGSAAVRFPTAAMARVDFYIPSWRAAEFGHGEMIWLVTPKMLKKVLK